MMGFSRLGVAACLLPLVTLTLVGCSPPTDAQKFQAALKQVAAGETDSIDCRKFPKVGDAQMQLLAAAPGLERVRTLTLDDTAVTDDGLRQLPWMAGLSSVSASKTQVTDAALPHLKSVGRVETLRLDKTRVTDAGLSAVGELTSLRTLSLWRCPVTDAGLAHLKGLSNLESLSLDETLVTGAGVRQHLAGLPKLRSLSVWKTKVGQSDAEELRKGLPALKVNR